MGVLTRLNTGSQQRTTYQQIYVLSINWLYEFNYAYLLKTNMYIIRARVQFKMFSFQMGCESSCVAPAPSLELCLAQYLWHETNVLDNWQCCLSLNDANSIPTWSMVIFEFFWGYMHFFVPEYQNKYLCIHTVCLVIQQLIFCGVSV